MYAATLSAPLNSTVRDWWTLLKPGVMSLVVFTGVAGLLVAPGHVHPFLALIAIFCIALGSGAGAAINMWYDRDIDAVMLRTSTRPIPMGRITPDNALAYGLFLSLLAVALMGLALNWAAAAILAFAIFFYGVIYTILLKRRTPQNIVIGGAAGAFPPMIGWAAVTGNVSLFPILLFLIIFLWTPPHFWALALYRSGDYAKAGVPMLPVVAGKPATKVQMAAYTIALWLVSLLPWTFGYTGLVYGLTALALGGYFLWLSARVLYDRTDAAARRMFGFSILYLFCLFLALILDSVLR